MKKILFKWKFSKKIKEKHEEEQKTKKIQK